MDTKDLTLLVIDSGLFSHVAVALAPGFARTLYYTEWVRSGFPEEKHHRIGDGLSGIERIRDVYGALREAPDVVVFPDVVTANLASHVKAMGIPVFGTTKHAGELELDRWGTREAIRSAELPVTDATRITGTDDLEKHLRKHKDQFVKHSRYRGDLETHRHASWATSEEWFIDLVHRLGPSRSEAEFIVEGKLEGVEVAVDHYSIDGQYPSPTLYGYEDKDAGYIGRVVEFDELPIPLAEVSIAMAGELKRRKHRGWIALETRVTSEQDPYVIDPCVRAGSPPSEAQMLLWSNWPEIVAEGANGKLIDPTPTGRYCASLMLKGEHASQAWTAIVVPEKYRAQVALHNHCIIDGVDYIVPSGIPNIGAVSGVGDTLAEAKKQCLTAIETIEAEGLEYDEAAFERLDECIEKGRAHGIGWE